MGTSVSKHVININRTAFPQNFLSTDQFKRDCLAHTRDHIWESTRQRPYSDLGNTDKIGWHPTRVNMSYKLNVNVKHRRRKITSKNKPGNKRHLR